MTERILSETALQELLNKTVDSLNNDWPQYVFTLNGNIITMKAYEEDASEAYTKSVTVYDYMTVEGDLDLQQIVRGALYYTNQLIYLKQYRLLELENYKRSGA